MMHTYINALHGLRSWVMLLVAALAVSGCYDSFEEVKKRPPVKDDNFTSPEVTQERVPIGLSMVDPQISVLETRGTGPKQDIADNLDEWKKMRFSVWAFRTPSKLYSEATAVYTPDGTASPEGGAPCLVNGNETFARIVTGDNYELRFCDKEDNDKQLYYSLDRQAYRYKFFMNYLDDATKGRIVANDAKTQLRQEVTIDGSQDLMVGFAYHTQSQLDDAIRRLSTGLDPEEAKMISTYREDVLYSTVAGHRGIHPIMNLRHVLVKFTPYVMGQRTQEGHDYRNILITEMSIEAPTHGWMVLADDKWDFKGKKNTFVDAWERGELFQTDMQSNKVLPLHVINNDPDHDIASINANNIVPGYPVPYDSHQVKTTEYEQLTPPVMVPLLSGDDSAYILRMRYVVVPVNENTGEVGQNPFFVGYYDNTYKLQSPENGGFRAGREYRINVKVYGPKQINVSVVMPTNWEDGGDVGDLEPEMTVGRPEANEYK